LGHDFFGWQPHPECVPQANGFLGGVGTRCLFGKTLDGTKIAFSFD
jgi:hypothetical protein